MHYGQDRRHARKFYYLIYLFEIIVLAIQCNDFWEIFHIAINADLFIRRDRGSCPAYLDLIWKDILLDIFSLFVRFGENSKITSFAKEHDYVIKNINLFVNSDR